MQANTGSEPWLRDPRVVPLPWRQELVAEAAKAERPLVFGVIWADGLITPHPPVTRALKDTVEKLRAAEHEVIDWDFSSFGETANLLVRVVLLLKSFTTKAHVLDHARLCCMQIRFAFMDGGEAFRNNTQPTGEPQIPGVFVSNPDFELGGCELLRLHRERDALAARELARWNASASKTASGRPVDVLLMPVLPYAGIVHDGPGSGSYVMPWSVFDYPALTVPVGEVEPEGRDADAPLDYLPALAADAAPRNESEAANFAMWQSRGGVAGFRGLPLSVQLVGRRFDDERLVGVAKALERALHAPSAH